MTTTAGLCRLLAVLVPLAACLAWAQHLLRFYPALPSRLAVHFSPSGEPNGWMSPRIFTLLTTAVLAGVLGSAVSTASSLPDSLFTHPLPPPASTFLTLVTALAVGAFFEIVRLARSPGQPRLRWSRIVPWPAGFLSLQIVLASIARHG